MMETPAVFPLLSLVRSLSSKLFGRFTRYSMVMRELTELRGIERNFFVWNAPNNVRRILSIPFCALIRLLLLFVQQQCNRYSYGTTQFSLLQLHII